MTLRRRLALVNVVVLLIALLLLAGIVLNQLVGDLYEQLDHDLALIGARELAMVKVVNGIPTFANNSQPLPQIGLEGFIRLVDTQGRIVDGVGTYSDTPVSPQTFDAPPQGLVFNQTGRAGLALRVYTRPVLANNTVVGFLQVANEREEVEETLQLVRRSLIFGIPLALLISGLISLLTARQALRPLIRMTQSAAAINAQDLTARLPVPQAKDEVQALALTFNATLDRLAAAFVRQRRFTADASHELRTPVTAILGQAELALSRPRDPKAYQATLTRIRQEAERMQRLIGRMLTLARVETGPQLLTLASTDVARLVHTLVETVTPQAEAKGLTLKANIPDTLIIPTDADSLTQILLNLLENAITYTDQGMIELSLTTTDDHLRLTVSDTGQGIPPDHLPHIFQPFYRVDPSRSENRGSVGLGLALTYELSRLLGANIEVSSSLQTGTTFTLLLPLENLKSSM